MRSPRNESLPCLLQPQYGTRSSYRGNAKSDCGGITTCPQEGNPEEIHSHTLKINYLRSCLVANSINMESGVQNSDDLKNIEKSPPFICNNRETDLQNIRKSPRLLVQNRKDEDLLECNQEGIKSRPNSQIEGLDRNKLCFPTEIISAKSQRSQNKSAKYEGETDLQNVRKSPRLYGKSREKDLQLLSESSEKVINCRKESHKGDLNREKLYFPSGGKFSNMAQVHNKSANDDGERDVRNTRTLPMVSGKFIVIGLQSIVNSSKKGAFGDESHTKSTHKNNLSLKTKAAPANMPHILNTNVNFNGVNDLQSIQKPVRLSGKNIEMDLQKKDPAMANFSFATDVELTTVTQIQNMSSDCDQETDLQTMGNPMGLSGRNRETNLDSDIECNEKGINRRTESQKKGSDLNTLSAFVLVDTPRVQNVSANSNGQMDFKNMRKSPRLSGIKRRVDLQKYSRKKVKLGAESRRKGCDGNNVSLPIEVKLRNAPLAQNQSAESNEKEIIELTSAPLLQNEIAKSDGCLLEKTIGSPLNSSESLPSFEFYVSSGKGINLIVDLNSSPSDWTKKIFETCSSSQTLQKKKFETFRHEIEFLRSTKMLSSLISTSNSFNKISPSHLQTDACPKSVSRENCPLRSYIPDRGDGSSDITETNLCIDVRTRDGHPDNSSKVNIETSGDHRSSSEELLETRITVSGTKASDHSHKRPVNTIPDGSHKTKTQGREVDGTLSKSGKCLGSRKSTRLCSQGGCQ